MDNLKVYDTKLHHRDSPLWTLLDARDNFTPRKGSTCSTDTHATLPDVAKRMPQYFFEFVGVSITDHVEYIVIMREEYQIFKRKMVNKYEFRTRYSLLEALDSKVGGRGLPGKKLFGNKDPSFV